jgi:cytochrome c biogenesis protein CcmG, thiol:disulfide interchange protein DsbE
MQLRYVLPLLLFALLVVLFIFGMQIDPRRVPSPLIDKPLPAFELAQLHDPELMLSNQKLRGDVVLVNVWASWCVSCRYEHPLLLAFSREGDVDLYGLNYKDTRKDALQWLKQYGDPYKTSAFDPLGRTGIDFGVYGVPETYVLDKDGIVRYKHIGPISQGDLDDTILPLIKKLRSSVI